MSSPDSPLPASSPADPLPDAVAAELHTRRWHLAFAPAVEARFQVDTAQARVRHLLIAGLVALAVYDSFLLNDLTVRPEVFGAALFWRLGCVTLYGLAALALVRHGLPARWREAVMASTVVVAVFASSMIMWHTRTPAGTYDLFVFSLIFMSGNIVFPLPFVHALVSSAVALAVAAGFAVAHPTIPAAALPFALGLLAGTAVFSVLACHRIERSGRQSYLLALREELRAQSAQRAAEGFARLSQTDPLTRLANRRAFDMALRQSWIVGQSQPAALAVLLIDIDHFKRFNDRFGHPAGDACLQRVAAALRASVRDDDVVARIGGEEFVVLLPGSTPASACIAAERLRVGVEAAAIAHDGQHGQWVVTISVGVALAHPTTGVAPGSLVAAADAALYQAKGAGRNRWVLAGGVEADVADADVGDARGLLDADADAQPALAGG